MKYAENKTYKSLSSVDSLLVGTVRKEVGSQIGRVLNTLESEVSGEASGETRLERRPKTTNVAGFGGTASVDHHDALASATDEVAIMMVSEDVE